jgi:hypothetical protein
MMRQKVKCNFVCMFLALTSGGANLTLTECKQKRAREISHKFVLPLSLGKTARHPSVYKCSIRSQEAG